MSGDQQANGWVDALDQKLIDAFPGRVVRKDLVYKLKVGFSIPVYVLEYLLGKYCSTTDEEQIRCGPGQLSNRPSPNGSCGPTRAN